MQPQADRRPDRYFYEVFVPRDEARGLVEAGFGLYPSSARHEDRPGGAWYVLLLDETRLERIRARGFAPVRAPRGALRRDTRAALDPNLDPDADLGVPMGGPGCDPRGIFCQYEHFPTEACTETIPEQLANLDAAAWPAETTLVNLDPLGTWDSRSMWALRIGPKNEPEDEPIKQLLLFGGQHAQEWAGVGLTMELARRILSEPDPAFQELLLDRAVLIIPVANPDGYQYSHTTNRGWRKNRRPAVWEGPTGDCPCSSDERCWSGECYCAGVDPNRNFPFNWHHLSSCVSDTFEGFPIEPEGRPEAETVMLDILFLHDRERHTTLEGSYWTRFYVNYHSYGNYVLFPDGISDGEFHHPGDRREPCRAVVPGDVLHAENCQPPDFAALRWIAGTAAEPQLTDVINGTVAPYRTDAGYRVLYDVVGGQMEHHTFGEEARAGDPERDRGSLGVAMELTSSEVGFDAECLPEEQWDALVDQHFAFVRRLLENLETLSSSEALYAEVGARPVGRVHRLRSDDDLEPIGDYGGPRYWIDVRSDHDMVDIEVPANFPDPLFPDPGVVEKHSTAGLFYTTWSWRRSDPEDAYEMPTEWRVCTSDGSGPAECQAFVQAGAVDLCGFGGAAPPGWNWVGHTGRGEDDCYLDLTARGPGPFGVAFLATFGEWALAESIKFNYSYRLDEGAFEADGFVSLVFVAPDDFQFLARVYPANRLNQGHPSEPHDGRMRTENIELPREHFDRASSIRIIIRAEGIRPGFAGEFAFRIYDGVAIGRKVE